MSKPYFPKVKKQFLRKFNDSDGIEYITFELSTYIRKLNGEGYWYDILMVRDFEVETGQYDISHETASFLLDAYKCLITHRYNIEYDRLSGDQRSEGERLNETPIHEQ